METFRFPLAFPGGNNFHPSFSGGGILMLSCRPKAESPAFPSFQADVNHKDDIQLTKSFPEPVNVQYGRVL